MERTLSSLEKWKVAHRDYYLAQKRRLAGRAEYKALRRERYRQKVEELTLLGILPRKRGRPQMYVGEEAVEMRRHRAREASLRYRVKRISLQEEKDEHENETASEGGNRSSSSSGSSADGPEEWGRFSHKNTYWALSAASG
jgi:hypothetical protein